MLCNMLHSPALGTSHPRLGMLPRVQVRSTLNGWATAIMCWSCCRRGRGLLGLHTGICPYEHWMKAEVSDGHATSGYLMQSNLINLVPNTRLPASQLCMSSPLVDAADFGPVPPFSFSLYDRMVSSGATRAPAWGSALLLYAPLTVTYCDKKR